MAWQHHSALEESEQRFQIATEAAGIGVWELDLETGRFQWNSHMFAIYGFDEQTELEPDYATWKQMLLPEDRQGMEEKVRQEVGGGQVWELEFRARRKDGAIRYIRAAGRRLCDGEGVPCKAFGINEDITARKESEWAREQAERERREFLAALSHDLRTPLSALIGLNDLLADTDLDEQQRHYLNLSRTAGETLLARINTILDLSRLEAGRVEILPEVFDLRSYLQDQVALLRTLAQRKGLELELELGESLPYRVYGDATRIGQVIYNLASNAIKFTDQGGVRLEVAFFAKDQLEVKVSDTGPGIAAEEQERIFGAFVQAGGVEKRKEGSGLGLRICRELARLMGGDVALDSTLGKGSVFTFTARLPAAEQRSVDDLAQDAVEEGTAADDVDRELEVLVAEDDPSNALLLCELLKRFGCRPVHVENGLDALERWRYSKPDLLLLDLQMPGADGRTVAYQVRQIEAEQGRRRTAVAILTAYPPSALEEVCEQIDCDQLLYKPIDKQALKGVLDWVRRKTSGKACKDAA